MGRKVKQSIAETFTKPRLPIDVSSDGDLSLAALNALNEAVPAMLEQKPIDTRVGIIKDAGGVVRQIAQWPVACDWQEVRKAQRYGKFCIDQMILEQDPELAALVMSRVFVVRAESRYDRASFEYIALGPDFDPCPLGLIVPEYEARFDAVPHGPDDSSTLYTFLGFFKK